MARTPSAFPPGASGDASTTAVVSVAGRRGHNEDEGRAFSAVVAGWPVTLLLVADGMGGHAHGEVASRLAADALERRWRTLLSALGRALGPAEQTEASGEEANSTPINGGASGGRTPEAEILVRDFLRSGYADAELDIAYEGRGSGMGTTLVCAVVVGDGAILANVGDSRGYVIREGRAQQITHDHSVVADAVRQGALTEAEAEASPFQHALTRALDGQGGRDPDLYPAEGWMPLGESAAVLLCSDGLSGSVALDEIADAFVRTSSVDEAARMLTAQAFEAGSPDNITLAVKEHGMLSRSGPAPLAPDHVRTVLTEAETDAREAPTLPPDPEQAPASGEAPDQARRLPWLLGLIGAALLALALWAWLGRRPAPPPKGRAPVVRGPSFPVPSAFQLEQVGGVLRWGITGIATRDDTMRVTVSFPADTLTRTVITTDQELPLAAVARVWPGGVLPRGDYVWRVEARSLSGSRLRSGPAPLILDRPVLALPPRPPSGGPEGAPATPSAGRPDRP